MPSHRARHRAAAAAAAALALAGCVDAADVPAFTAVRDGSMVGASRGVGASGRNSGATGGLVPKMVAGSHDYLTSISDSEGKKGKNGDALLNKAGKVGGAGASRFYTFELINHAKTFLESYSAAPVDQALLAKDFEFEMTGPASTMNKEDFLRGDTVAGATEFYEFSLDTYEPTRIWFHARWPAAEVRAQSNKYASIVFENLTVLMTLCI